MLGKTNDEVLKRINFLKYQKNPFSESIKEKLIYTSQGKILKQLEEIFKTEENSNRDILLEKTLEEHWGILKHGSLLTYTALPTDNVTLFLCDVARYLSKRTGRPVLSFLMPGIEAESVMGRFPDLVGDVKQIIKTHILSTNAKYLIPVRALCYLELEKNWEDKKLWMNPYFNYETMDEESAYFNQDEILRLRNHSLDTKELFEIKDQYESLLKDESLFSHLITLIRLFKFNSKKQAGSEYLAGEAVYSGIIRFNDYYRRLPQEEKNKIPSDLKKEISFVFDLCSDEKINHDSTVVLETCVDLRQAKLEKLVLAYRDILYSINIQNTNEKESLIKFMISNFTSTQKDLSSKMDNKRYKGSDLANITSIVLDSIPIKISLSSKESMAQFLTLSPAEIQLILNREIELQKQLARRKEFESLDDLFKFLILTISSDRLETILSIIGDKVSLKLFPDMDAFLNFSSHLTDEYFSAICVCLQFIIKDIKDFYLIIYSISDERKNIFLDKVKDSIASIIKEPEDFQIFDFLNNEAAEIAFERVKNNLKSFIKDEQSFCTVVSYLKVAQCHTVCRMMGDDFWESMVNTRLINNNKLVFMLNSVDAERCREICKFIKSKLPDFYESIISLSVLFTGLDKEALSIFCEAFKDILPNYLTKVDDFDYFMHNETTEEALFELIVEKLAGLSQNIKDLKSVLSCIHNDRNKEFFLEMIKENLPVIVKNEENFNRIKKLTKYKDYDAFKEKFFYAPTATIDGESPSRSRFKRYR